MELQKRFENLASTYTKEEKIITLLWEEIETHYTEKHRAYHNLTHIEEIFSYFDMHKTAINQPDIVSFSVFYHDIIYSIWKKNNEEKSAGFALKKLPVLQLPTNFYSSISAQILATKTHNASTNDMQYLIDFDLGILGQTPEKYKEYTLQIRKEYQPIPSLLYKKGRKKVIQHFLAKKTIYSTFTFKNLYEQQARVNLTNELNSL